jgi:hydroxymethylbilane synthase
VIDRDDTRDIAIFNERVEEKIKKGEEIIIGTCSPRREEMAIGFLQKALPQWDKTFTIATKHIRGNVDTRLCKLDNSEYDGIILATAGLNRLLSSETDGPIIRKLLVNKKLMLLPLVECVPAPCQGAIVAEVYPTNKKALRVLDKINDPDLFKACAEEKQLAMQYGVGCLQRFGVTSISYGDRYTLYAAGKDKNGFSFHVWEGLPAIDIRDKNIFSTTDHMGNFFQYDYTNSKIDIKESVAYIANYKAVNDLQIIHQLQSRKVWAAGTKTWFDLAQKKIWVQGCADAFGLEFLKTAWQMPLFNIGKESVAVITSNQSAALWKSKGWNTYGAYDVEEKQSVSIETGIRQAGIIFWTSFRQYQQYKNMIGQDVIHACPYGETAEQFEAAGVKPVIFPNIKAFQQWRQISIPSPSAA